MSTFWKLTRLHSDTAAYRLKNVIPELKGVSSDRIADYLRNSDLEIFVEYSKKKPFWIRLTLPFAAIVAIVLFVLIPINYLVTGRWHYNWIWLRNWFQSIGF